jgi:hypothetical protein
MAFRLLSFLSVVLLSQVLLSQQKVIDVPFEDAGELGKPIEVTGKISVAETFAGNEVRSWWVENVTGKNVSTKPILLLIGILDAVGPHSDGGYELIIDRFFSERVIQPGDTFLFPGRKSERSECCMNPLDNSRDPKAEFRIQYVQFLDGSSFGDSAAAKDVIASRNSTLRVLKELERTYSEQGEQSFIAHLEKEVASDANGTVSLVGRTEKKKGTDAATSQLRKMIALAENRHEVTTANQTAE